jgi:hypothetical protein
MRPSPSLEMNTRSVGKEISFLLTDSEISSLYFLELAVNTYIEPNEPNPHTIHLAPY